MTDFRLQRLKSPLDSFIQYFLDAKPYHTKLLEVIEIYRFFEEMNVNFDEDLFLQITLANDPLCKPTGFGLDYDDECGYDAVNCCDLFDCSGGYGFIFDNSDLLVDLPIVNSNIEEGYVDVSGNYTTDKRIKVTDIQNNGNVFIVNATDVDVFNTHKTFLNVTVRIIPIKTNTENTIILDGNHANFFNDKNTIYLIGTETPYNGAYGIISVNYDSVTDDTILTLSGENNFPDNALNGLDLQVRSSSPNAGIYQTLSTTTSGTNGLVTIQPSNTFEYTNDDIGPESAGQFGSMQIRTGLKYPRYVFLDNGTGDDEEHKILYSEYNSDKNTTRIYLSGEITYDENIKLYGYFFAHGYDGNEECTNPKPEHIYASLEEKLNLTLTEYPNSPLYSFGSNNNGRTGLGTDSGNTLTPTEVNDSDWNIISAGSQHSIAIKFNRTLWSWGDNSNGRTGLGIISGNTLEPIQIGIDRNWNMCSVATNHSLMLKIDGTLWVCGSNGGGKTGLGTDSGNTLELTQIGSDTNWKYIDVASSHSLAIKEDGTLWSWGANANGRTGLGTISGNTLVPTQVGTDTNWISVNAGINYSLAIKEDGTLWSWGNNNNGRTGLGTDIGNTLEPTQVGTDTNWISVSAGASHSLGIKDTIVSKNSGSLWSWGINDNGRTGLGTDTGNTLEPTQIGSDENWIFISASNSHSLSIKNNGTMWAFGSNNSGRTGLGTSAGDTLEPTQVGTDTNWEKCHSTFAHSLAIKSIE